MPKEILIQGGHVVTVDRNRVDFADGDVLIRDGVVAEVGPHLAAPTPDAEVIDGDPVAVLVLGAGPADVETVIVGSDVVKRDGQLVGAHVQRAHQLMRETQDRLRSKDTPSTSRFSGRAGWAVSSLGASRETVTR